MAWFLFVDESGHDRNASPYEVLAGVAVRDRDLWNLIEKIHQCEFRCFGRRYSEGPRALKGKVLLKRKVFQHLALNAEVPDEDITNLARQALDDGADADVRMLKALAQAKLDYVSSVFDELEKSQSHILVQQAHQYFTRTAVGRHRASRSCPNPFFVHSDLATGVQLADLVAYVVCRAFRIPQMTKPAREELSGFAGQVARLRHATTRERQGNPDFRIWSLAHIPDLRTRLERDDEIA